MTPLTLLLNNNSSNELAAAFSLQDGGGSDDEVWMALLLKLRLLAAEGVSNNNKQELLSNNNNDNSGPYLLVLASIIFLLSLVANVLVVVSVFRSRRYRATAGLLALNLTVADLLITVVLLPLWMIQQNLSTINSYLFSIIVCKIHPALLTLSVGASAYTLVALSVDRMCIVRLNAARMPAVAQSSFFSSHHHQDGPYSARLRQRHSSLAAWLCCCQSRFAKIGTVAAPWLLSTLVAAPVLYFRTAQEKPKIEELVQVANLSSIRRLIQELYEGVSPESSCREEWPAPFQLAYDQSLLVIHFALPALVQLCLYIYLGWVVSRLTSISATRNAKSDSSLTTTTQQTNVPPANAQPNSPLMTAANNNNNAASVRNSTTRPSSHGTVSIVRRQRAWRTLIALSVLFPISWLPYYILYTYLVNADPAAIGPRTTSLHTLLELFAMLGFSNSAQNAIVYCATDDRLRGSVKTLLLFIPCLRRRMRQNSNVEINEQIQNQEIQQQQQVVMQMKNQQPRAVLAPTTKPPQQRQQRHQYNGQGGSTRITNNNPVRSPRNNYAPSPKLLAPPEHHRRSSHAVPSSNQNQHQQQRLRSIGVSSNINHRLRKQASLNVPIDFDNSPRCPPPDIGEMLR